MHEIRTTVPSECVSEAARLAHAAGIERVTVTEVFVHGLNARQHVVSVETSTPKARTFVELILTSPELSRVNYTLTSRELRAIVSDDSPAALTHPMSEPFPDVIQDLWQLSHLTTSYVARAAAGSILLATGIMDNDPIAIVVAALFLPFLAELLAISFGFWSGERRLILQGIRALIVSTLLAFLAGTAVAWITGGPIRFDNFRNPLAGFAISAAIGITAGLSNADDTGRRYLIGVAAAVQLAIYPAWFGAALIAGLPSFDVLQSRLLSFAINLLTIAGSAVLAYAVLPLANKAKWIAPRHKRLG